MQSQVHKRPALSSSIAHSSIPSRALSQQTGMQASLASKRSKLSGSLLFGSAPSAGSFNGKPALVRSPLQSRVTERTQELSQHIQSRSSRGMAASPTATTIIQPSAVHTAHTTQCAQLVGSMTTMYRGLQTDIKRLREVNDQQKRAFKEAQRNATQAYADLNSSKSEVSNREVRIVEVNFLHEACLKLGSDIEMDQIKLQTMLISSKVDVDAVQQLVREHSASKIQAITDVNVCFKTLEDKAHEIETTSEEHKAASQKKLAELECSICEHEKSAQDLDKIIETHIQKSADIKKDIADLFLEAQTQEESFLTMRNVGARLDEQMKRVNLEICEQIDSSAKNSADFDKDMKNSSAELSCSNIEFDKVKTELENLSMTNEKQAASLKQDECVLRNSKSDWQSKLSSLHSKNEKSVGIIDIKHKSNHETANSIQDMEKILVDFTEKIGATETSIGSLSSKIHQKNTHIEKLENRKKELTCQTRDSTEELSSFVEKKKLKKSDLSDALVLANDLVNTASLDCDTVSNSWQTLQIEMVALTNREQALSIEVGTAKEKFDFLVAEMNANEETEREKQRFFEEEFKFTESQKTISSSGDEKVNAQIRIEQARLLELQSPVLTPALMMQLAPLHLSESVRTVVELSFIPSDNTSDADLDRQIESVKTELQTLQTGRSEMLGKIVDGVKAECAKLDVQVVADQEAIERMQNEIIDARSKHAERTKHEQDVILALKRSDELKELEEAAKIAVTIAQERKAAKATETADRKKRNIESKAAASMNRIQKLQHEADEAKNVTDEITVSEKTNAHEIDGSFFSRINLSNTEVKNASASKLAVEMQSNDTNCSLTANDELEEHDDHFFEAAITNSSKTLQPLLKSSERVQDNDAAMTKLETGKNGQISSEIAAAADEPAHKTFEKLKIVSKNRKVKSKKGNGAINDKDDNGAEKVEAPNHLFGKAPRKPENSEHSVVSMSLKDKFSQNSSIEHDFTSVIPANKDDACIDSSMICDRSIKPPSYEPTGNKSMKHSKAVSYCSKKKGRLHDEAKSEEKLQHAAQTNSTKSFGLEEELEFGCSPDEDSLFETTQASSFDNEGSDNHKHPRQNATNVKVPIANTKANMKSLSQSEAVSIKKLDYEKKSKKCDSHVDASPGYTGHESGFAMSPLSAESLVSKKSFTFKKLQRSQAKGGPNVILGEEEDNDFDADSSEKLSSDIHNGTSKRSMLPVLVPLEERIAAPTARYRAHGSGLSSKVCNPRGVSKSRSRSPPALQASSGGAPKATNKAASKIKAKPTQDADWLFDFEDSGFCF